MKKVLKNSKNILKFLIFVIMIYLFIFLGTRDYTVEVSDNIRFSNEFKDISKNNVFRYINDGKVLDIMNGKSGIILMGFSSNIWTHYYADYLNEVALLRGVSEIYYYDFKRDRSLNGSAYHTILKNLKDFLHVDDLGKTSLAAPTVLIVKNGQIIYFLDEIQSIKGEMTPEDYFTDYKKNLLKNDFDRAIQEFLKIDAQS